MTFDPAQVPQDEYENPPDGRYLSQAIETGRIDKDNGIRTIWAQMEIMEGPFERRQYRLWMDIVNPGSPIKEKIGNQDLGKLTMAAGKNTIEDSSEIEFIPMYITLKSKDGFQNMKKAEPYSAAPQGHQPQHGYQQQPANNGYQQPAQNGGPAANNGNQRRWGNRASA
ncbi:hypothetical protein B0E33_01425 [Roseibium algicola]|uniref:Single-stranded DNA-binding protein n=2 Tax=Roseibium algicola TaxID=2857014 RepID=A0ABN4WU56_9HYPH|nr:hypothetical protein B0E33_01425 [Roseibium aggregatum]